MRKGLKVRSHMECVRIQKHFGVTEYKAEAGSGKKQRKEPERGGPYKLCERAQTSSHGIVRTSQGFKPEKESRGEMSKHITKVGKALSGSCWKPCWCQSVSEQQCQVTPTLLTTFSPSLHSQLRGLQGLQVCLCEKIKNTRIIGRKARSQTY